jgi:hypothetical protein
LAGIGGNVRGDTTILNVASPTIRRELDEIHAPREEP